MEVNYTTPIDEIKLRYVIIHSTSNLETLLKETFRDVALTSYNIESITDIFQLEIISTNENDGGKLSIAKIQLISMPYNSVGKFENAVLGVDGILEVCKTYDSSRIEENRKFLTELYNIEMKIREIYTVLTCLQNVDLKNSRVKLLREYQDNIDVLKKRLMNEFFFIEFSDYKNVDGRKDAKLEDLLDSLRRVTRVRDIRNVIIELSHPTLHLEERFNELSRIPEAIGRLENFRNNIAHNRYVSGNDVENFEKARSIIDDVYDNFLIKLKNGDIWAQ